MKKTAVWMTSIGLFLLGTGCAPRHGVNKTNGGGGNGGVMANVDASEVPGGGGTGGSGGMDSMADLSGTNSDGCPASTPTAVAGRVFAPNGTLPLYNATVFVPNGPLPMPKEGVSCDRCGDVASHALTVTQTDANGAFKLIDVPAGKNIQVVIEVGKWRRTLTVPQVNLCETVMLPADQTRLPRSTAEGNMPKMAIATGSADPFECLLLKIGIDKAEVTAPTGTGRVHFYQGATMAGTNLEPAAPLLDDATNGLMTKIDRLMQYDVVLLPCEGTPSYTKTTDAQRALLPPYLDAGGRLFTTHYGYNWLTYTNSPYNVIGMWNVDQKIHDMTTTGNVDTSFPKGKAFGEWLHNVDPKVNGSFSVEDPRYDIDTVAPKYAQRWVSQEGTQKILHTTFNTPLNPPVDKDGKPQYCGRVVFSDFHVTIDAIKPGTGGPPPKPLPFPSACKEGEMTTQEKALAFMLFDLSSCVIPDQLPPIP